MTLLILSIVLSVSLMIAIAVTITVLNKNGKINKKGYLFVPLGLLGMLVLLCGSFVKINANEVGIIYHDFEGLKENTYSEGFKTKSIFEHITTISTANKTAEISTAAQTSDSSYATFQITIIYKIESQNAGKFYKSTSSKDISEAQLASIVKEALQSSTIQFDIYSILGEELEQVREVFTKNFSDLMMNRYSITIISTSFDDIDAGERIEEIIKNKAEALQQIEIAEAEKQKATVDAETAKIKAETEAQVAKIKADNEAEIKKIEADAEAYKVETEKSAVTSMIDSLYDKYQSTLSYEQCAEIVLQTIFYEKWDGKLPEVLTSDSLSSLIGSLIKDNK